MKISRSYVQDGNIYPEVYNYLRFLPNVALHQADHDLLHPLAIYNISLDRVTNAFSSVLDEYDKLSKTPMNENDEPVLNFNPLLMAQTELLESLLSHIDDGYQILKALHPPVQLKKPVDFADKWLSAAKHPTVENFKHVVRPYRESFALVVNQIKHVHGRLRAIWMYNPNEYICGYFLNRRR